MSVNDLIHDKYLNESRVNNLRHQHGDMHIVPTVSFARIYANITKCAQCIEKSMLAKNMSILVLFFTKSTISIHILIIVDTATDYPQTVYILKTKSNLPLFIDE